MAIRHTGTPIPVVRSIPGPAAYMCGLTWDGQWLWHSDQEAEKIFALDPETGDVRRMLACDRVRADLTYHDGLLCQIGGRPKRIVLIDPVTGEILGEKPVNPPSGRLCGTEMAPDGMWMCLRAPAVLQLRDFDTMGVLRQLPIDGSPSGLAYADGTVVYGDFEAGVVRAVDTRTGWLLAAVPVEGHPVGMTWDGRHVWYCDFESRRLKALRLDDILAGGLDPASRREHN